MESRYYLALFNDESWSEFLKFGANIYGTKKNKQNRAEKIHAGDYFICYISKISIISGILKIKSEAYYEESQYWSKDIFPVRFQVQPLYLLNPGEALQIDELKDNLKIFKNLKNKSNWAGFFINAFNEFPTEDGEFLIQAMKEKLLKKA